MKRRLLVQLMYNCPPPFPLPPKERKKRNKGDKLNYLAEGTQLNRILKRQSSMSALVSIQTCTGGGIHIWWSRELGTTGNVNDCEIDTAYTKTIITSQWCPDGENQ